MRYNMPLMEKTVSSIGFIMDGNRRWAVENGMAKTDGHKHGLDKLMEVIDWCEEEEINDICVYAFSTENWNRSPVEVEKMMSLLRHMLTERINEVEERGARVRFVGDLSRFSKDIQELIESAHERGKGNSRTLWICVSYGGRAEIEAAADAYHAAGGEGNFEDYLWTKDLPDPEFVIRTGGDQRLSNFLLWKVAYSQIYFIKTYWPGFEKEEFLSILNEYREKVRINKGK